MSDPQQNAAALPDGTFVADAAQSRLDFRAKAFGLVWVRGFMPAVSGTIRIANGRLHGVGEVSAHRISTGLGARDGHLRTSHYLHASRHPNVRMSIEDADIASGTAACEVVVRDTPATVQLGLDALEFRDGALRLRAHTTLDRTVYPMLPPLAGVSRLVHLDLTVTATPADSATA